MRPSVIALICLFALSGCDTDLERLTKVMEKQIQETVDANWRDGLPLGGMVQAQTYCQRIPSLKSCDTLQAQMQDIAISLASCRKDGRSTLCQTFTRVVGRHPIASRLPLVEPLKLPQSPWYWEMPTASLEVFAGTLDYREEAFLWWWEQWKKPLLSCLALVFASYSAWKIYKIQQEENQKRQYLVAQQKAELAKQERIRKEQESRARADAEHRARREREFAIAEKNRIAVEQAAKRKADEATAKLEAEQAEAAALLNSIFKASHSKEGKS